MRMTKFLRASEPSMAEMTGTTHTTVDPASRADPVAQAEQIVAWRGRLAMFHPERQQYLFIRCEHCGREFTSHHQYLRTGRISPPDEFGRSYELLFCKTKAFRKGLEELDAPIIDLVREQLPYLGSLGLESAVSRAITTVMREHRERGD